ncbi:hypothetical protein QQZ08_000897 [Neonectria magnoliae]|uniref:Myb/SANT-like domain-containing protein n=1 Tax=Neonectria magnoliae TaxID=2732573 RepID=A0ABR1IGC1_9HYPO
MDELCLATRDGKLNSTKDSIKRGVWDQLEVVFDELWPDAVWDAKVFEGKLRQIRDFWRVFREILDSSGTLYNPNTGKVSASRQNEKMFIDRYGVRAKQAFQNGLLVGNSIGIEAYEEIFARDPRTGTQITEAHEDVGIVPSTQEGSSVTVVSTRGTGDDEGGDSFGKEDPCLYAGISTPSFHASSSKQLICIDSSKQLDCISSSKQLIHAGIPSD